MNIINSLPTPSSNELAHSEQLRQLIIQTIQKKGGSITFRHYMEMALYQPSLGYYVSGTYKIGAQGDFITAPEIHPIFAHCLASYCIKSHLVLKNKQLNILELGAGSGQMAVDLISALDQLGYLPQTYFILELSPDLKQRQQKRLKEKLPHYFSQIRWLEQLPEKPLSGIVIGNEVLDAMPVEKFTYKNKQFWQHYVTLDKQNSNQLTTLLKPATGSLLKELLQLPYSHWKNNYTSELNPNLSGWCKTLSKSLINSHIILIDYGYLQPDYYLPDRSEGTLICHYRHHAHDNAYLYPGLQDITANVNFSALKQAMQAANIQQEALVYQSHFLLKNQLEQYFNQYLSDNPKQQYRLAQAVRTLTLPSEMGEHFKVATFSCTPH